MEMGELFQRLGIATGLGLLVGLQRERTGSTLAGFRTFPLVALFGALAGLLAELFGGWTVAAGLIALASLLIVSNLEQREARPGTTTEVAVFAIFLLGAYLMHGSMVVGVAVGGTITVLLHLKPQLHSAAKKMEDQDFQAIMQFVLITLVILPVLPNRGYGPFEVLNPYKIWLMVVLIVGISLVGYIIYKFAGEKVGVFVSGILGGLISSTATTVSYARATKKSPESSPGAAFVIMTASTVVLGRVLVIIGVAAPALLPTAAWPMGALLAVMLIITAILWWRIQKQDGAQLGPQKNPSELKGALIFAALYALVLLAVAAARHYFGSSGLYVVSVLSGLTDMDAITLSVSQMSAQKGIEVSTAWRLIMIAALSNMVFKTATIAGVGDRKLLARTALAFGLSIAAGLAIVFLWPAPSGA